MLLMLPVDAASSTVPPVPSLSPPPSLPLFGSVLVEPCVALGLVAELPSPEAVEDPSSDPCPAFPVLNGTTEVCDDDIVEGPALGVVEVTVLVAVLTMVVDVVLLEEGEDVADVLSAVAVSKESEPSTDTVVPSIPAQSC